MVYRVPAKHTTRFQLVLSPELRALIEEAAKERGISMGTLVREAVEKILSKPA